MDYELIAKEVETKDLSESNVHKYMGNNVKSPGLVKGSHYIVKYWSVKSLTGGDNPFWIGQFIGAGQSHDMIIAVTPRAKEMVESQRYFFRMVNGSYIAASNFNGALVVNDDNEQRITFYALLGEPKQDALPLTAPTLRADKSRPVAPAKAPREYVQKVPRVVNRRISSDTKIERTEEISDEMRALFRKGEPPTYRQFLVAQFRNEEDARQFAKGYKQCQYIMDGVAHLARVPDDDEMRAGFLTKAKDAGAISCYGYQKIVETPKEVVINEGVQVG